MNIKRIKLLEPREGPVLSGSPRGKKKLVTLLSKIESPSQPEVVFLDFQGVEVATTSFLRESVLAFRDFIRSQNPNLYPVIANPAPEVKEELEELLRSRGDVIMICTLDEKNKVSDTKLIGELDPKQKLTLNLVHKYGETDAGTLMRDYGEGEGVKQTAWNNRLASLAAKGLVMEISIGRAKRYMPLFQGA